MGKVIVNDIHLYNLADAIRAKAGNNDTYTLAEMANAIDTLSVGAGEKYNYLISGDCSNLFHKSAHVIFDVLEHIISVETEAITNANNMFSYSNELENINTVLNFVDDAVNTDYMFCGCYALNEIPTINNCKTKLAEYMFYNCRNIRELPEDIDLTITSGTNCNNMFYQCLSLRKAPTYLIDIVPDKVDEYGYYLRYSTLFGTCFNLDEIVDLPLPLCIEDNTLTTNPLYGLANVCCRLSRLTFKPIENEWFGKNASIDLQFSGHFPGSYNLANSGITEDKKVVDDATYQALKNDPDWFTTDMNYSRYNKASVVETINSLPTCVHPATIIFTGKAGAYTDGGAIETMTEEEIAVATAKGWTISYV